MGWRQPVLFAPTDVTKLYGDPEPLKEGFIRRGTQEVPHRDKVYQTDRAHGRPPFRWGIERY